MNKSFFDLSPFSIYLHSLSISFNFAHLNIWFPWRRKEKIRDCVFDVVNPSVYRLNWRRRSCFIRCHAVLHLSFASVLSQVSCGFSVDVDTRSFVPAPAGYVVEFPIFGLLWQMTCRAAAFHLLIDYWLAFSSEWIDLMDLNGLQVWSTCTGATSFTAIWNRPIFCWTSTATSAFQIWDWPATSPRRNHTPACNSFSFFFFFFFNKSVIHSLINLIIVINVLWVRQVDWIEFVKLLCVF